MKKLMMLICLLVTSFSMFACDKEQIEQAEKILVKRSNDTGETAKNNDTREATKDKDNPSQPIVLSEVGKHLRAKECDDYEIREMQKIEKETYGPTLHPINCCTGIHFNYAGCEDQTHANCGLYAVKRFLHHMGQLGRVPDDLWYRYSDKELRDFVVRVTRHEPYRNQNEGLTDEAVLRLLIHLGLNNEQLNLITLQYVSGIYDHDSIELIYNITHGRQRPSVEPLHIQ